MTAGQQPQLPLDPVDAALEAVKRLDQSLRSKCASGGRLSAEAIARRAKDAPQLILQSGLVPALAFMLSKLDDGSKRRAYAAAVEVLLGQEPHGSICTGLSSEGGGYPQIAALLLTYASTVAGCDPGSIRSLDAGLLECLETIRAKGVYVERLVVKYAEEVKKLATALYAQK